MRKIILSFVVIAFVLANNFSYAQNRVALQKAVEEVSSSQESYRIDPQPLLQKIYDKIGFDPANVQINNTLRKTAWNFQVGSTKIWWVANFKTGASSPFYQVSSTCRAIGSNCYIFVADSIWGTSVNQAGVDSVVKAFDSTTPANPNKGIYRTNVDVFGSPPNVDGDDKIIILILDIKDDYSGPGAGFVAGYFSSYNESQGSYSNKGEIYFLDGVQQNLIDANGLKKAMSTTAHEFQHMIHWNYIKAATTFFNECWSLTAEIINGYGIYSQSRFANESNQYLLNWRGTNDPDVLTDYSRAARFGLYLYEQFGASFFGNYLKTGIDGIGGLDATLANMGSPKRFASILPDWFIANYVNDKNLQREWWYEYLNLPQMVARVHVNPKITYNDKIYNYGVQYISFTAGKNLTINFDNNNNSLIKVKAFKYGQGSPVVEDVSLNTNYLVPDFGTTYSRITFAVYMIDLAPAGPYNYSYTATGIFENKPLEIAYDTGLEPTGVLSLTPGDSVAVVFNGITDAKLDSIRVALRQAGSVTGGVYSYLGKGTQLGGKKLAAPITVTSTIVQRPQSPYPVPWPNWVKYDLRSYNIAADNSFVVMFVIEGAYPATNRVMVTDYVSSSAYYSYFYQSSSGTWVYYSDSQNPGSIFLNLIRAYVSFGTTDVKQVVELKPASFKLEQNYPNPFNPSTNISYKLQAASYTTLIVYDMLGREVAMLVNEEQPAGTYQIVWNGTDNFGNKVTSGVYFYRIAAGDFIQTKKMTLLK